MNLESEINLKSQLRTYKISFFVSLPFVLFGVLLVFSFAWAIWELTIPGQRVSLPSDVNTIAEFTKTMPEPEGISVINISGNTYLVLTGGTTRPLPSGEPIYIFDKGGKIISWTMDSGDASENHPYLKYFIKPDSIREISLEEALKIASETNESQIRK